MRRTLSILATALLAASLLTVQAEARGGGGGGHAGGMGGGFGGGAHFGGGIRAVGGLGGAHFGGGAGRIGGHGGAHIGGIGAGDRIGAGVHTGVPGGSNVHRFDTARGIDRGRERFAMHRFDRFYPYYYYGNDCYDWYLLHPDTAVPPYCS